MYVCMYAQTQTFVCTHAPAVGQARPSPTGATEKGHPGRAKARAHHGELAVAPLALDLVQVCRGMGRGGAGGGACEGEGGGGGGNTTSKPKNIEGSKGGGGQGAAAASHKPASRHRAAPEWQMPLYVIWIRTSSGPTASRRKGEDGEESGVRRQVPVALTRMFRPPPPTPNPRAPPGRRSKRNGTRLPAASCDAKPRQLPFSEHCSRGTHRQG